MFRNAQGQREIDGRAEMIRKNCEDSLQRLKTDVIDLYYLHRWDKRLPVEESVGALADLVKEGKVRAIGLSEVSATTLRKAHAVHPIAAVQTEYSLWTRNAEVAVLDTCRELGIAFVAFSPLARGFFGGQLRDVSTLPPKDIRLAMPRFQGEHFAKNLSLLDGLSAVAREYGLHDGAGCARLGAGSGPAHHSDSGNDAARSPRGERRAPSRCVSLLPTIARLNELINPTTVSGAALQPDVQQKSTRRNCELADCGVGSMSR